MAYCTTQDIESYFLGTNFRCGDYLTNGKAYGFIAADSALIDASLRVHYSLPITNTSDLILLKTINEMLTVGTIDDIFQSRDAKGNVVRGRDLRKTGLAMLEDIKNGKMLLSTSQKDSIIKFNTIRTDGEEVLKRFRDEYIDNG